MPTWKRIDLKCVTKESDRWALAHLPSIKNSGNAYFKAECSKVIIITLLYSQCFEVSSTGVSIPSCLFWLRTVTWRACALSYTISGHAKSL